MQLKSFAQDQINFMEAQSLHRLLTSLLKYVAVQYIASIFLCVLKYKTSNALQAFIFIVSSLLEQLNVYKMNQVQISLQSHVNPKSCRKINEYVNVEKGERLFWWLWLES